MNPHITLNGARYELDGKRIRVSVERKIAEFAVPSPARCAELATDGPAAREFWMAIATRTYGERRSAPLDYAGNLERR